MAPEIPQANNLTRAKSYLQIAGAEGQGASDEHEQDHAYCPYVCLVRRIRVTSTALGSWTGAVGGASVEKKKALVGNGFDYRTWVRL
jgi:hypothetical protein